MTSLVVSTCLEPSSITLIIFVILFLHPFSIITFSVLFIEATPGGNSSSPSSFTSSLCGLLYFLSFFSSFSLFFDKIFFGFNALPFGSSGSSYTSFSFSFSCSTSFLLLFFLSSSSKPLSSASIVF